MDSEFHEEHLIMRALFILFFIVFSPLVNAQEQIITTSDGVELFIKVKGDGYPLLYIHGGPGAGSHWLEEFFGDFMEQHFKIIYLDQRGAGRSTSPPDGNFGLERMLHDFEEVRKQLQIENWFTLSHSFGGIIQMAYADKYPDSHRGLLMVNSTMNINESICESWIPKAAEFLNEEYPGCERDSLSPAQRFGEFGEKLRRQDLFWKMAYRDKKSEELMNDVLEEIQGHNYDFSNAVMNYQEYFTNYKSKTENLEFPVLFFFGEKDWMTGPEHYKDVNFPNLQLWKNSGGHMPFIENKKDLQEAILQYIKYASFIDNVQY